MLRCFHIAIPIVLPSVGVIQWFFGYNMAYYNVRDATNFHISFI